MTKCNESGCRSLEWKCADCGRVASTATIPNREHALDKAISSMDELVKTLESLHKELSEFQKIKEKS